MNGTSSAIRAQAEVHLVNAFTTDGAGGNLAGVVIDADGLSNAERQHVAAVVGASETSFVRRIDDRVFEVEFFTPSRQVPDCGHATVATFALLAQQGALQPGITIKRTIAGDREISLDGERVFMQQLRPALVPFDGRSTLASALGIAGESFAGEPVVADNGVRFVLVRTASRDVLASIVTDQRALEELTEGPDAIGVYVAAPGPPGYDATARMFAPRYGIAEESATGMAAGLFGGWLAGDMARARYRIEQGALMTPPSPSTLIVQVEPDRVLVGGTATVLHTMPVMLPARA